MFGVYTGPTGPGEGSSIAFGENVRVHVPANTGLQDFLGVNAINQYRRTLSWAAHERRVPLVNRVAVWTQHKVVSVASLATNAVALGIGTAGAITCACTLGVTKAALFALSAGFYKPEWPAGVVWFGERTFNAAYQSTLNLTEIIWDVGHLIYLAVEKTFQAVRWVGRQLHLEGLALRVIIQIGRGLQWVARKVWAVVEFVLERVAKGWEKASAAESSAGDSTPLGLRSLNDLTKSLRIWEAHGDRSVGQMLAHTALSVANIPLNFAAGVCSAATATVLSTLFAAKVGLYAATNINIPVPTGANHAINWSLGSAWNVTADTISVAGDAFLTLYKVGAALRLGRVMATAGEILLFIPRAIFS